MTPYIIGLIHGLEQENSTEKDCQKEGTIRYATFSKMITAAVGIQQTQNVITATRRTLSKIKHIGSPINTVTAADAKAFSSKTSICFISQNK